MFSRICGEYSVRYKEFSNYSLIVLIVFAGWIMHVLDTSYNVHAFQHVCDMFVYIHSPLSEPLLNYIMYNIIYKCQQVDWTVNILSVDIRSLQN